MLKTTKKPAKAAATDAIGLTLDCLCGGDEMVCSGPATSKGFRKFYCQTCRSTLWLSPSAFETADGEKKIMER